MRRTYVQRVVLAIGLLVAAALVLVTAGTPAQAQAPQQAAFTTTTPTPDTAEIQGTIIDGATLLPADDVRVCAATFAETICRTSRSDGTYRIGPLNPGNYVVRFESSGRFIEQCWQASSCSNPTRVSVQMTEDHVGIDAVMELIPGLPPTLTPTNTPTPTPPITPDATPVPPTPPPTLTPTSLPIDATVTPATPTVTLTPTPTPPLDDFEAAISGRITVLSTGEPVFGASVCAQRSFPAFERCAFSAADGRYTIRDLQPGNYTVTASDLSQRFVDNCYGAQSCDGPERIGVNRNEQATDIDIAMDPVFSASVPTPTPPAPFPEGSIAGRVLVDGEPRAETEVCAITTITRLIARCAISADDGSYVLTGLSTANYRVQARIIISAVPSFELIEFCYRDDPGCNDNVSVGVVSPFSRQRIDLRISSDEFDEARVTITPTPTPVLGFEPTPTPTPTATSGPVDPNAPIPYSEFDRSGPWTDVPHIGTLGVGTYATGTYRFGSPVEPVIELMTTYFGPPSGTLDQGRVTWWGPDQATPLARIEADAANRLAAASINLEENSRLGLEPVFLGDVWLFSGNFALDAYGLPTDRFIYLEDDAAGNAIRCASDNFCTIQRVERDANGQVTEFGNIIEFFADAESADATRITGNVTADGRVQLRTAPSDSAPALRSIDLSGGVTAGIVGGLVIDAAGTPWVRLTEGRDPLSPAGWAPADGLRASPVADRLGPLPRFVDDPPELDALIGLRHDDGWDSLAELFGIEYIRSGSGSGTVDDENGDPVLLARFVRENGAVYDFSVSDQLDDGTWQIRQTMRLRLGTDQVVIAPGNGRCPWLGGAANHGLFVADLDKDAVVAWEWRLGVYEPVDVTGLRCDREDRG